MNNFYERELGKIPLIAKTLKSPAVYVKLMVEGVQTQWIRLDKTSMQVTENALAEIKEAIK